MKESEKKSLIIIGAGGFGREVFLWSMDIPAESRDWTFFGFLDENPCALNNKLDNCQIIGNPRSYVPKEKDVFLISIGDPLKREEISNIIENRGGRFITLVHPSAKIGYNSQVGCGCILCPNVVVTSNVKIGNFVMINVNSTVGHDVIIEDGCTISGHADVTGNCHLGKMVFVGSHASILPGMIIEDYANIGAGSVVLNRVNSGETVMGVPARTIFRKKL
jgi:sugar O-acyltransferase (sialic acid O-acetyltransferase NeuD family)